MSLTQLLTRDCTITHREPAATVDDYGDHEFTETTTTVVCELQQRQRDEHDGSGETSRTMWLLIVPAGTVIATQDTVTVDGADYELYGEPWTVRNPRTGVLSHVEATVTRVTGGV